MVRLQRKIIKSLDGFNFFTERNFNFNTDKLQKLYAELEADDKVKFNFDHSIIDWNVFIKNSMETGRQILFKEGPETIPAAQKKLKRLYIIHLMVKVGFYLLTGYFLIRIYGKLF